MGGPPQTRRMKLLSRLTRSSSTSENAERREDAERREAPHPDDPRKPDDPRDLHKPTWRFAMKRSIREFIDDQCTDVAAALTYYGVLALFPAMIAVVSLLGLFGQGPRTTDALLGIVDDLGPRTAVDTFRGPIENLTETQAAGFGLVVGLLLALWSASGYVSAFSRAMNRIYEIEEGRPFLKLRPLQMLITLGAVLLISVVAAGLVLSGSLAEAVGRAVGMDQTAVTVWQVAKWPLLVAVVIVVIAVLYYATPNIQQPRFRWMSLGAFLALVVWVVASVLFAFYVSNFGSYDKTYGTLAGAVVFLLWLWITNLALLLGAEFDSELERGRQLQSGMEAEEELQLPPRDTRGIEKRAAKEKKALEEARRIRQSGRHL
jgi:membrane protein